MRPKNFSIAHAPGLSTFRRRWNSNGTSYPPCAIDVRERVKVKKVEGFRRDVFEVAVSKCSASDDAQRLVHVADKGPRQLIRGGPNFGRSPSSLGRSGECCAYLRIGVFNSCKSFSKPSFSYTSSSLWRSEAIACREPKRVRSEGDFTSPQK